MAQKHMPAALLLLTVGALAAGPARSECFSAANADVQAYKARYAHSAVLIDVVGPGPECQDKGVGVIVSSYGDILTARHVVDKPDCSNRGVFAIFGWNPPVRVELDVTVYDNNDAAFLRPKSIDNWNSVARYCTAPVATEEGGEDESFLRFGRIDLRPTAYGYGGNVILNSTNTGQPPLQLICSVIIPGDSGGPVFSSSSGKFLGITVKRREKDMHGNIVINQGYLFPAKYLLARHRQRFNDAAQCRFDLIQKASATNLDIEVPYVVSVAPPAERLVGPAAAFQKSGLTTQIFSPVFGYGFNKVESIMAADAAGKQIPFKPCATDAVNCVSVDIVNNLLTVIVRGALPASGVQPIRSVTVYTSQKFGSAGLDYLASTNPALHADVVTALSRGTLSGQQTDSVFTALTKALPEQKNAGSLRIETLPVANAIGTAGVNTKFEFSGGKKTDWFVGGKLDALKQAIDSAERYTAR